MPGSSVTHFHQILSWKTKEFPLKDFKAFGGTNAKKKKKKKSSQWCEKENKGVIFKIPNKTHNSVMCM